LGPDGTDGSTRHLFWPGTLTNWELRLTDPAGAKVKVIEFTFASGLVRTSEE
jgi:hypothetical protein